MVSIGKMFGKFNDSLVTRVGALLLLIAGLALTSMISSFLIAEQADKDAASINLSGKLRMMSFQIAFEVSLDQKHLNSTEQLNALFNQFEYQLKSAILTSDITLSDDIQLKNQYLLVVSQWDKEIRPYLESRLTSPISQQEIRSKISEFVAQVNQLVLAFQANAEDNIKSIRIIQLISVFATIILVYISVVILKNSIESPLSSLTIAAENIRKGDFTTRINIESKDELGVLALVINKMTKDLGKIYGQLEQRVQEKTEQLELKKQTLQFLFEASQAIATDQPTEFDFEQWTENLAHLIQINDVDLCLTTPEGKQPFLHVVVGENYANNNCAPENCEACFGGSSNSSTMTIPLTRDHVNYGALSCRIEKGDPIEEWKIQVLHSFADLLAVHLSLKNQEDQDRRMALMTERTTIARELHDSIAQALSYLKIQVTRLKRISANEPANSVKSEIIEELDTGLNSAYRQLRELLTTFRLQLTGEGLFSALTDTVEKHRELRPEVQIDFDYQVTNIPLSPNEEIHLLQLAREAMQNAVNHSKGDHISLFLTQTDDGQIDLKVIDNGIGIPDTPEKLNHYGLAIMQERARNLGAKVSIERLDQGTQVFLSFKPNYLQSSSAALH